MAVSIPDPGNTDCIGEIAPVLIPRHEADRRRRVLRPLVVLGLGILGYASILAIGHKISTELEDDSLPSGKQVGLELSFANSPEEVTSDYTGLPFAEWGGSDFPCDEAYVGSPWVNILEGKTCLASNGQLVELETQMWECRDGRTLWQDAEGYGVIGEPSMPYWEDNEILATSVVFDCTKSLVFTPPVKMGHKPT